MKKQVQLGLVVEGKSGGSAVLHLPTVPQELGPVKSGTLRVARRLSNALQGGYPVAEYEELQAARLILIRVPDRAVPRIVDELCASGLVLRDLAFVLCESWMMSDVLEPLRARGAATATLIRLPGGRQNWFAVEGQSLAVRQTRRLLERNQTRALLIRPRSKPLVFAAELFSSVLPLPLLNMAQQALRISGVSGNHLSAIIEQMNQKMFNDFVNGARVIWGGPLTECSSEAADTYLKDLERSHPQIAEALQEQLSWARRSVSNLKKQERRL